MITLRRILAVLILAFGGIAAPAFGAIVDTYAQAYALGQSFCSGFSASVGCEVRGSCGWVASGAVGSVAAYFAGDTSARNCNHYRTIPTCPGDQVWNLQTNVCEAPPPPTCTLPQYLDPTTNQCVDSPTCASGQHLDDSTHACVPDSEAPAPGTVKRVPVDVGQSDGGDWCVGGCSYPGKINSEGWEYDIGEYVPVENGGGCSVVSGRVICYFDSVATGNPATPSAPTPAAAPPSASPPSNPTSPSPGCPSGYSVDANGNCQSPGQPGSPSTTNSPGSSSIPGGTTCPVGYSLDPTGRCVGTPGQGTVGCPSGYSYSNGQCVASTAAQPVRSTEQCGAPGQPACAVNTGAVLDVPQAEALQTANAGPASITPVAIGGPAAQCPADVSLPHGITWSWATICDFASFLRPIVLALAWVMAGVLVLGGVS